MNFSKTIDMTSHELAKLLLEGPDVELCVLKVEKKNMLSPVIGLHSFDPVKTSSKYIAILSEGQRVDGNLYWKGDSPFVPEGTHYSTASMRVRK